jgi:uncharacterized RDD family membrane protein YckC
LVFSVSDGLARIQHVQQERCPACCGGHITLGHHRIGLGIGLFFLLLTTELQVGELKTAPMWRRYAACFIDLWFFVFVFANTTAIVPLLIEAERTGSFRWHFERDFSTSSDWMLSFLILIGIAAMASYFVLPFANRRQTIGPWLLRITTVNADGLVLNLPLRVAFRWAYAEISELFSPFFSGRH